VEPGTQGFLRGALRALVRERRQHGLGDEQPFRLLAHPDGRLTLEDPATGRPHGPLGLRAHQRGPFCPPAGPAARAEPRRQAND
jgi:hypothetical protein